MSTLRTLIEQHNYNFATATSKLRRVVQIECEEAANMNTLNPVGIGICAIGVIASLTNPLGILAGITGIIINATSKAKHSKDYRNLYYELELIKAAPRLPDIMNQYHQTGMLSESELMAIHERLIDSFAPSTKECLLEAYLETGEAIADYVHPEEALKQFAYQAILSEDPAFKLAGIPTGVEEFNSRLEEIRANHSANNARRQIGIPNPQPQLPQMRRDIGSATRFGEPGNGGALPIQSTQVQQSTVSPTPVEMPQSIPVMQVPRQAPQRQRETALDALLASPYISRALFGAQRTGKSYLAAIASRKLSEQGTKAYHLNLASFGTEDDEYWTHATKSVRGDLPSISDPDDAIGLIEDAIAAVEEWFTQPDSILIVDELAYLGSSSNAYSELLKPLLKIIADKIACLSSTGIKRRQAIWTIAPEFVAGGLTQDARAVKKLQLCYVSIAPNRSVDWNGSRIGFNGELFEQIKNNFPIEYPPAMGLNSDRICFVNNKWLAVGELPRLGKPPSNGSPGSPSSPNPNQPMSPMASVIKRELEGGEPKKS